MLPRLPLLVGLSDRVFACRISGTLLARQAGHVSEALDSWLSKGFTAQAFLNFHRTNNYQSKSTNANRDLKQSHPHP